MGIIKKFKFDNVDSSTYGIGITGEAVYNSPERDVEMISIPGRNGDFALDRGRFNNIEVTYPAGMGDSDQSTFATRISGLRNALASKVGYQRLEDEYNPDEYRMAIYQRGLEVSPAHYSQAGEFDITFNCKPQRFLKSGETAVSVANNGSINNPTLFNAKPLLLIDGYGDFSINSDTMNIQTAVIGNTILDYTEKITQTQSSVQLKFNTSTLPNIALSGDDITVGKMNFFFICAPTVSMDAITGSPVSGTYGECTRVQRNTSNQVYVYANSKETVFDYGTSATHTENITVPYTITYHSGGQQYTSTGSVTLAFVVSYNGTSTFTIQCSITAGTYLTVYNSMPKSDYGDISVNSTKSATGQLYIDLDIGDCYQIINGEYVSINTAVSLPPELPVLKPGTNTITYDNTITSFKITPRWWKV